MRFVENKIVNEIKEAIKDWDDIEINLPVPPNGCQPLQNQQCMNNAMNEYKAHRSVAIIEVVAISDNQVVAHYLCMTAEGKVYDPTLGWEWSGGAYKLSKYIHPENNDGMSDELYAFKDRLFGMCKPSTRRLAKLTRTDHREFI